MMRKYLMTGLAAVALSGLFSGCSQDAETGAQINTAEFNILENYENAFVARFGQPAENQNWGFGSSAATRGVNPSPSVTPSTKTYNAQMAIAWTGVEAAKESGSDQALFSDMDTYVAWKNSGWTDQFFDVHGTVESSTISEEQISAFTKVIVGTAEKPGLIPENVNNLAKAQSTGYSIVTTGGPVTLTPIYHYSNSGDRLSYYYYPAGSKPSPAEIKTMPKYSLGNMSDPQHNGETHFYRNTYSLVYVDADGNCSYDFPANYVINFVISNTWNDYAGGKDKIYQEGGVTSTTGGTDATLTSQGVFKVSADDYYMCGSDKYIDGKVQIKFGNTLGVPQFTAAKQGSSFTFENNSFDYYMEGNGINGSLDGGNTCYYLRPEANGTINVGVKLTKDKKFYVKDLGYVQDPSYVSTGTSLSGYDGITVANDYNGVYSFPVEAWHMYAVYAEGSKLGFYGFEFVDSNGNKQRDGVFTSALGPFDCGFSIKLGSVNVKLGKTPAYFSKPKPSGLGHYTAYTAGTGKDGGLSGMATTYYFLAWNPGVIRVAVSLNENKRFYIKDLGENGWNNTSGTSLSGYDGITVSSKYNGTYDFPVEANHVYAVYAEGSKLGFYGCEFLTVTPGVQGSSSTSNVVWKEIPRTPDYYSDGDLNTEIHSTTYGYGVGGYGVTDTHTSHTAVFKSTVNNIDYTFIGFEDWVDFDFNDLVFAVTGTTPEIDQPEIEIPDDEEEEEEDDNPGNFVCRVIAEDLTVGENSDFDFNDVVFDVFCDGSTTTIRLRAAGGELPLYVDGHEVHQEFATKYFDVTSTSLVNTGWRGSTLDYNNYYVDFTIGGVYNDRESVNSIPVVVTKKGKDKELVDILLTAKEGKVASKVCVGRDYEWCAERQDIDSKYHNGGVKLFHEYVIGTPAYRGDWADGNAWYQLLGK